MTATRNQQSPKAEWRLRFGLVGTHGNSLIVRRGDLSGSVSHRAIQGSVLYEALHRLGKRFCYRDLLGEFRSRVPDKQALHIIGYLKNEAQIIAAPIPDVPESELLISDCSGGFITPGLYRQLDLALVADSDGHRDELIRIVRAILGRPPKIASVSPSAPIEANAVVLCTQGLDPQAIREVEGRLTQHGSPWFTVADFADSARAGPFNCTPHKQNVCSSCLDRRIRNAGMPRAGAAVAVSRQFTMTAILGIHQLIRLIVAPNNDTVVANRIIAVSADLGIHGLSIAPMPGCARCGTDRSAAQSPQNIKQRRVAGTYADADLRDYKRETALDRYRAHVGPLDVIQDVREVIHPYVTGIPAFAAAFSTSGGGRQDPEYRSFIGVGPDREWAELASLARAMERLSLCQDGTESGVTASAQEVGPEALLPSSWGPGLARYDQATLRWTKAHSLIDGGHRFVPSRCVFYPYTAVNGEGDVAWFSHPYGTGCDLSIDGALLWALLELVEADTMVRIDTYGLSGRTVDLSACGADPQIANLLEVLQVNGYRVVLKDCSLDFGIPVVAAIVVAEESSRPVSRGSCAHLCGTYAIRHALREAVRRMFQPQDRGILCSHLLATSGEDRAGKLFDLSRGSVHDDLEFVLTRLRRMPADVLAIDLARPWSPGGRRPENEVYCVRAIAPKLVGPMSTPGIARLVALDPDLQHASRAAATANIVAISPTTDDGPIGGTGNPKPAEQTSVSPPLIGDERIVVLGQGVLAGLVNERLQSLGGRVSFYSEADVLLRELDSGQARPGIVIAALGEMPARIARVWNAESHVRALPWIAFTQRGDDVECGPLVRGAPHRGCYWCVRMHAHNKVANLAVWERKNELLSDSAGGIFHAGARLAVECLLEEVALFLSGEAPLVLKVHRFGPNEDMVVERYSAVTDCPVCGSRAHRIHVQ